MDSAKCGPMGGEKQVPTSTAHRRTTQWRTRGEGGQFPNSNLSEWFKLSPQNDLAQAFDGGDRGVTPSMAKVEVPTNATLSLSEQAMGNPPEGLKMAVSGLICTTYGGGGA